MMDKKERRVRPRHHLHLVRDAFFRGMRFVARHAGSFYAALGVVLVAGAAVAIVATLGFMTLAGVVREGATQQFDEAVLRWVGTHQVPWLETALFEITLLGTGIVVVTLVAVSALFLWLSEHRFSALLLLIATWGGVVINGLLKSQFDRPRPQVCDWGAHVLTSSFPSGHAMSATIAYGTVAYLAARLHKGRSARLLTLTGAGILIALICASRIYLCVHYPSDVVAGVTVGLAWSAFCMATLEAIQVFGKRFRPKILDHEEPPPAA